MRKIYAHFHFDSICLLLWIGIDKESALLILHMEDSPLVPGTLLVRPAQCKPEFQWISNSLQEFKSFCKARWKQTNKKRFMPGGQSLLCCGVESCKRETSVRIQLVRLPDLLKGKHLWRERIHKSHIILWRRSHKKVGVTFTDTEEERQVKKRDKLKNKDISGAGSCHLLLNSGAAWLCTLAILLVSPWLHSCFPTVVPPPLCACWVVKSCGPTLKRVFAF